LGGIPSFRDKFINFIVVTALMRKAMYAFSGDPITYGHIDIIARASRAFDRVVVGIGVNPDKKYMFSLEERTEMAQRSLSKFPNVEVVSFQGLLVDYAYENGINVIVKGVRNAADFDYENVLHQVGESQKLGVDTHILFARPELAHISSSVVKGIQKEQGLIHEYVPLYVKQCLEARMSGQYIVGVTGEIGAGKSYVSQQFSRLGEQKGIAVHDIELDQIGHQILGELKQPRYDDVRRQIANTFGQQVRREDGTIDRKSLGEIVFSDQDALNKLNEIMTTPLLVRLRKELYGKKGLILFNAALIAESDMGYLCNNNVVLVYADKKTQESRLASRGLTLEQMQRRLGSQFDYAEKKSRIQQAIDRDNQGKIWAVDNSEGKNEIEKTFDEVVSELKIK
jgi:pantetheine-phosphate adenylyltransferase